MKKKSDSYEHINKTLKFNMKDKNNRTHDMPSDKDISDKLVTVSNSENVKD